MSERNEGLEAEIRELRRQMYDLLRRFERRARQPLPTTTFEVLICSLEGSRVALPLSVVDEVIFFCYLTPLPEAPSWVPGLLALPGETLPVLDVAARVRRGRREAELSDLIVLVTLQSRRIGLVVQDVLGIAKVDPASVEVPPESIPQAPYLAGVRPSDDGDALLLIDSERLVDLSDVPDAEAEEVA